MGNIGSSRIVVANTFASWADHAIPTKQYVKSISASHMAKTLRFVVPFRLMKRMESFPGVTITGMYVPSNAPTKPLKKDNIDSLQEILSLIAEKNSVFYLSAMVDIPVSFR